MSEHASDQVGSLELSDLEKRFLAVLSVLEANRTVEDTGEYLFPDGRKVKPTIEGIRSLLREGSAIEDEKMNKAADRLQKLGLTTRKADCHFLSDSGKRIGRRLKHERMSKGYDGLLLRTETSKAYSLFCERVFGKDLSQYNVLDMEQLGALIEKLNLKPGEVALDLGCGNGRIAEHISDVTGATMVGLDFAAEVIKRAQQRTAGKKDRLTYVVGDMDELSLEERSFDAVVSIDSLYFVEDVDATIGKMKSLVKPPNGRLAIFFDQSCGPEDSRDVLQPENTKVGVALKRNGLAFETVDYTANSREIWVREIEAAEALKDAFAKEGNADIYEDRAQDAKRTLKTIDDGRQVRHFYFTPCQG